GSLLRQRLWHAEALIGGGKFLHSVLPPGFPGQRRVSVGMPGKPTGHKGPQFIKRYPILLGERSGGLGDRLGSHGVGLCQRAVKIPKNGLSHVPSPTLQGYSMVE